MIDLTIIKIDSTLDLSLIIFIIGLFSYYFGKLIEETNPTKEVRQVTYMSGILFIFLFVALPILIIYQFSNYLLFMSGTSWWLFGVFVLQTLLFFILHKKVQAYNLMKSGYGEIFGEKVEEYTSKLINSLGISKFYKGNAKKTNEKILLSKLSTNWLFIIVLFQILIFFNVLNSSENILFQFVIFAYLFLSISNAAILYGWSQVKSYPEVKVHLIDKNIVSGRLMKIEEDYVNVRNGQKVWHINKININFIEKDDNVSLAGSDAKIEKTSNLLKKVSGTKN